MAGHRTCSKTVFAVFTGLFVLALLVASPPAAFADGDGGDGGCDDSDPAGIYRVTFVSVTYNADGTSTWSYTVTKTSSGSSLSYWVMRLCHDAEVVSSSPAGAIVGYHSAVDMYGIKWIGSIPLGVPVPYSFTLDRHYEKTDAKFAVKYGTEKKFGEVCGPSKYCDLAFEAPGDLVCSVVDPCVCESLITWTNIGEYDFVNIRVDGALVATLPGSSTSHTLFLGTGSHTIEVTGVEDSDDDGEYDHEGSSSPYDGGGWDDDDYEDDGCDDDDPDEETDGSTCTIVCPDNTVSSPADLICTADALDCSATITWTNTRTYAEIVVLVDGVPFATLAGSATSIELPGPFIGLHQVCLAGSGTCGNPFPAVCCSFTCDDPVPPPVTSLICDIVDECTCTAEISWTNGAANYDTIQVLVDGNLVSTLPGTAISTMVDVGSAGDHTVCIVAERNGNTADYVCCSVDCPEIPSGPITALICDAPPAPSCVASAVWLVGGLYSSIQVLVDGALVQTLPGDASAAEIPIPSTGPHEICLIATTTCGAVLPEVCCSVECIGPPDPVAGLVCTQVDLCTCLYSLAWTNGNADYDLIRVFIDGVLHEQIPGDATSLALTLPSPGMHEICLVPVRERLLADPVCCTVDCPDVPPSLPEDLSCTASPITCLFTASWTNPVGYASIEVLLDGSPAATLPGSATSYAFPSALTGPHEICVRGTTVCGEVTPAACCSVDCTITPPLPVIGLVCGTVDPCTCVVPVSWTNQEGNYDSIEVTVGGLLVATLPGSSTGTSVPLPGAGTHAICVTPVRSGVSGAQSCCDATCPITAPNPPVLLECVVEPTTCQATISWIASAVYSQVAVSLNGVLVQVLPGDSTSATVTLTMPGVNVLSIVATTVCGVATAEISCNVSCPSLIPAPVNGLVCVLEDTCTCEASATWVNGGVYDSIAVVVNGVTVATLPGTATSADFSLGAPSTREVCIVPTINAVLGPGACCTLTCEDVRLTAPNGLTCTVGPSPACETVVSWQNRSFYSAISVTLDGVPVASLPGDATGTQLSLPGPGPHSICVVATTICGDVLPGACCTVECLFAPAPPAGLSCSVTQGLVGGPPCAGTIAWTNAEPNYDTIEVTLDGVPFTSLPGSATSLPFGSLTPGPHEFCLVAVRAGLSSPEVCCTVACPVPPPPVSGVTCAVGDACACSGSVSWTNGAADYDEIVVQVDGATVATLPGNATSTPLGPLSPGAHTVCVIALRDGFDAAPVCCDWLCAGPPPAVPPSGLTCAVGAAPACATTVSWTNNSTYSSIVVTLDNVVVAALAGNATQTVVNLPGAGPHQICLLATTTCGAALPAVCCTAECAFAPPAPTGLVCALGFLGGPDCSGTATWVNGAPDYDSIAVTIDGVTVATLPGNATSFPFGPLAQGPHQICLVATRDGLTSPPTCCTVDCPVTPDAPVAVSCSLTDACTCTATVNWTNGDPDYDQIRVELDGVTVATLGGGATSAPLGSLAPGAHTACVIAIRDGLESPEACCVVECAGPAEREEPTGFSCSVVDPENCTVGLAWTNEMPYSSIQVLADGVVVLTLPGTATSAEFDLPGGVSSSEVCLVATTPCGLTTDPVCCTATCLVAYLRGDCNLDGHIDIGDGIYIMRFLFQGFGISPCMEACDHNGDATVDVSDTVYVITYIFLGGPPPAPPFGGCGTDATPTPGCTVYPFCVN